MILTAENYYTQESNRHYLSVSQYKDFCGTYGKAGCEEYALAKLDGTWVEDNLTYWNSEIMDYASGEFYMPDIKYTISHIDRNRLNMVYDPFTITLIEY